MEEKERIRDALAKCLMDVYVCIRVWDAWSVGTMSEDDFSPAWEDEELFEGMVDAVLESRATESKVKVPATEMLPILDELHDAWLSRPASREKFPKWWDSFSPIIRRILRIRNELKEAGE